MRKYGERVFLIRINIFKFILIKLENFTGRRYYVKNNRLFKSNSLPLMLRILILLLIMS